MIASQTPLYSRWTSMNGRCRDTGHSKYRFYGGKGIKVCQEWRESFDAFRKWALGNGFRTWLSIDRIDPDDDYKPDNCQWIPIEENRAKARTAKGSDHYKAVLNEQILFAAHHRKFRGESTASIARHFSVSPKTLGCALRGENWKHIKAIVDREVLS
jgi:hypothetical protein